MSNKISHEGVVESVSGDCVRVRIVQSTACASCKISSHCNASESKVKFIDVITPDASSHHVGDAVTVSTTTGIGNEAVRIAFVWPLLLLLVLLFGIHFLSGNDTMAVLVSFAGIAVYYLCVWLLRGRIGQKFQFAIQ